MEKETRDEGEAQIPARQNRCCYLELPGRLMFVYRAHSRSCNITVNAAINVDRRFIRLLLFFCRASRNSVNDCGVVVTAFRNAARPGRHTPERTFLDDIVLLRRPNLSSSIWNLDGMVPYV